MEMLDIKAPVIVKLIGDVLFKCHVAQTQLRHETISSQAAVIAIDMNHLISTGLIVSYHADCFNNEI